MVALAANFPRPSRNLRPYRRTYPVNALSVIFDGSAVMIGADGMAIAAGVLASNQGCVGVACESVTGGAADGDVSVTVEEGEFLFAGDTLTAVSNSAVVFADDDNTVDETQTANAPRLGLMTEFVSATSAWVLVSLETSK